MSADKKTPTQWAKELGQFIPCRHKRFQRNRFSWQHAAAAVRHGWKDHEMATSEEHLVTLEEYEGAIAAVSDPKAGTLKAKVPPIHAPAVSPFCVHTDKAATEAGIPKKNEANRKAVMAKLAKLAKEAEEKGKQPGSEPGPPRLNIQPAATE
jgi:hypothetical protein